MLVVTSDHGEELFDHGGVLHGHTLYDEMLHVPLVVWWPGQVPPRVIDDPTDTLDVHATLRGLVAPRSQEPEGGDDLWRAISGSTNRNGGPRLQFATAPGLEMGRDGSLRSMEADPGSPAAPGVGDGSGAGPYPRGRIPFPPRV